MNAEQHLLPVYTRQPVVLTSGIGCYVTDNEGKRYLDMVAGIGVNALGYSHPSLVAAMSDQAAKMVHSSNLFHNPYQAPLADRLCEMSGLDRAFFSNSGTEAMEAAIKGVRAYWRGKRTRLVALNLSFHGRTTASLSITGQASLRSPFTPLLDDVVFIDANDTSALEETINDKTAALILEPVLGEGGVHPLTDEFLRLAREVTEKHGVLLVADETQCGLGRTGKYFAYQWSGINPDIVVTAKPLAGGLPLGATLFTASAASGFTAHSHGTTFGGGPLACRTALVFLEEMDALLPNILERAGDFRMGLEELRQRHSSIVRVRSKGLMFGIQLARAASPVVAASLERGLIVNATQESVVRMLPPYIVQLSEVKEALSILDAALAA